LIKVNNSIKDIDILKSLNVKAFIIIPIFNNLVMRLLKRKILI